MNTDIVIVGSGFFGLTIAERCATFGLPVAGALPAGDARRIEVADCEPVLSRRAGR